MSDEVFVIRPDKNGVKVFVHVNEYYRNRSTNKDFVVVTLDNDDITSIINEMNPIEEISKTKQIVYNDTAEDIIAEIAQKMWEIRRVDEDRCDMELWDLGKNHPVWKEARAAFDVMLLVRTG